MPSLLPKRIDRPTLRMITVKRLVTGSASVLASVGLLVFGILRMDQLNGSSRLYWALGVAIFAFGGSWSLRDGLRGRRLLRDSAP